MRSTLHSRFRFGRWRSAIAASIALHALILAVLRPGAIDPRPVRSTIDSRIDGPMTLSLVESPPEVVLPLRSPPRRLPPLDPTPPLEPTPLRTVAAVAPVTSVERGSRSENGSAPAAGPSRGGDAGTGGRALHKPLPSGARVVYLLDRSGSMSRDDRLRLAVDCIRRSIRELRPDTSFAVVAYHSRAEFLPSGAAADLAVGSPENVRRVEVALADLIAEGGSAHVEGLRRALSVRPDAVMLLTDADDLPKEMVEQMVAMCGKTRIFPVIFGSDYAPDATSSLKALAKGSRGVVGRIGLPAHSDE